MTNAVDSVRKTLPKLAARIDEEFEALSAVSAPSTAGYTRIQPHEAVRCGATTIAFDEDGAIVQLETSATAGGLRSWVRRKSFSVFLTSRFSRVCLASPSRLSRACLGRTTVCYIIIIVFNRETHTKRHFFLQANASHTLGKYLYQSFDDIGENTGAR